MPMTNISPRKKLCQFRLSSDVIENLKQLERGPFTGIASDSVVETAILYLHAKYFQTCEACGGEFSIERLQGHQEQCCG
jgi:hypothetical protein